MRNFRHELGRQLRFIETSCNTYDGGSQDEAVRIATCLRTLFHDTKGSRSLLRHLGARNIKLLSTCEDIPRGIGFWANLTDMTINPQGEYAGFFPKLESARTKRMLRFDAWWSSQTVYRLDPGVMPTRRDIVLAAANKDGGAHVDANLEPFYQSIQEGAGWKMTCNTPDGRVVEVPFLHGHLAALRQMGYEVLNSPELTRLVG